MKFNELPKAKQKEVLSFYENMIRQDEREATGKEPPKKLVHDRAMEVINENSEANVFNIDEFGEVVF